MNWTIDDYALGNKGCYRIVYKANDRYDRGIRRVTRISLQLLPFDGHHWRDLPMRETIPTMARSWANNYDQLG